MLSAMILVSLAGAYAMFGLAFAVWFSIIGVNRIDSAARTAGIGFRMLIVPGAAALWPWLLRRCREAQ